MADINHTITLGIGTPGAIPEFLTFGLQIGAAAIVTLFYMDADVAVRTVADGNVAIRIAADGDSAIRIAADGDVEL